MNFWFRRLIMCYILSISSLPVKTNDIHVTAHIVVSWCECVARNKVRSTKNKRRSPAGDGCGRSDIESRGKRVGSRHAIPYRISASVRLSSTNRQVDWYAISQPTRPPNSGFIGTIDCIWVSFGEQLNVHEDMQKWCWLLVNYVHILNQFHSLNSKINPRRHS